MNVRIQAWILLVGLPLAGPSWSAPPIAVPDAYAMFQDTILDIPAPGLIANDVDPDGDPFILNSAGGLSHGTFISLVTNGSFSYQPDAGFVGTETFTYLIRDVNDEFGEPVEVTIEVLPNPNRAPIAIADFYITPQNTTLTVAAPGLIGNDIDPDGDTIILNSAGPLSHGTFTSLVTNGSFEYEPDPGFTGTETFNTLIRDAIGEFSEPGEGQIQVIELEPGPPIGAPDAYAMFQDTILDIPAPGLIANDVDPDGDPFILNSAGGLSHGTFISLVTNGSFSYQPDAGFVGTETFTYQIRDDNDKFGESVEVTIEVLPNPNRAPIAIADFYVTPQNTTLTVAAPGLIGNDIDPDGDAIILNSAGPLSHGTFTSLVTNGSFEYEPDPGFTGTETFNTLIRDANGEFSELGTATILVGAPPTLTLVKEVINNDGGTAAQGSFALILTGADGVHDGGVEYSSGDITNIKGGVEYTVSEQPLPGYELLGIACVDPAVGAIGANGVFTTDFGRNITCTITNDDVNTATFAVSKEFSDNNPSGVEVSIICNTGLPLEQSRVISEGSGVTFVVKDFEDGAMDCTIVETVGAEGYEAEYFDGEALSESGCTFEAVELGDDLTCAVSNTLLPVDVQVTKTWIDENPEFQLPLVAEATYGCVNEQNGETEGELFFNGNPDTQGFSVFPHWNGTTTCTVIEVPLEGNVEFNDSDCSGLSVVPGRGADCVIVNTRLFAGIPALGAYGLAILFMLMLIFGLLSVRRI